MQISSVKVNFSDCKELRSGSFWRQSTDFHIKVTKLCQRVTGAGKSIWYGSLTCSVVLFLCLRTTTYWKSNRRWICFHICEDKERRKKVYYLLWNTRTLLHNESTQLQFHISKPSNTPTIWYWKCLKCYKYHCLVKDTQIIQRMPN